jgi:hypothetical protein
VLAKLGIARPLVVQHTRFDIRQAQATTATILDRDQPERCNLDEVS